jgi:hypothetical protein
MTAEWIYAGVLVILSFIFDLVPGAKDWWEKQPEEIKRWGWLIGSAGVPMALWALACYGNLALFGFKYQCDGQGLLNMAVLGIGAYWLSQGGHSLAKLSDGAY